MMLGHFRRFLGSSGLRKRRDNSAQGLLQPRSLDDRFLRASGSFSQTPESMANLIALAHGTE